MIFFLSLAHFSDTVFFPDDFSLFESLQTLFWATFGLIDLENFELTGESPVPTVAAVAATRLWLASLVARFKRPREQEERSTRSGRKLLQELQGDVTSWFGRLFLLLLLQ